MYLTSPSSIRLLLLPHPKYAHLGPRMHPTHPPSHLPSIFRLLLFPALPPLPQINGGNSIEKRIGRLIQPT